MARCVVAVIMAVWKRSLAGTRLSYRLVENRSRVIKGLEILERSGTLIGIAIARLINPIVIIGGGVAETGDLLTAPIRKMVKERSLRMFFARVLCARRNLRL